MTNCDRLGLLYLSVYPTFRYGVRWDLEDLVEDFDLSCSVLWGQDAVLPAELTQDCRRLLRIAPHIVTVTGGRDKQRYR